VGPCSSGRTSLFYSEVRQLLVVCQHLLCFTNTLTYLLTRMARCSDLQNKKGIILQASVDYIKRLKKEQLAMSDLVARQDQLEKTNRQLTLDIQVKWTIKSILFEQSFTQRLCSCALMRRRITFCLDNVSVICFLRQRKRYIFCPCSSVSLSVC